MEALITRTKRAWVKPARKLTPEEIDDILEHWDYDPDYDGRYDEYTKEGIRLLYDEFGNPSYGTLEAMYETEHGLTEPATLDDLRAWVDSL